MKKYLYLFFLSAFVVQIANSQTILFSEDFATGIPGTWQNVDNTANNSGTWQFRNGQQFVIFDSDGLGNDGKAEDADLITPSFDCSGQNFVALSFVSAFQQYANSAGRVSVSVDGGTTWAQILFINTSTSEEYFLDISTIAANQSDVKLKFNYTGNYDYFWILDNIRVYVPLAKDFEVTYADNYPYYDLDEMPLTLEGSLINLGRETITAFDLNYTANNGAVVTQNVTGVNIAYGNVYNYSHNVPFNPSDTGTYEIKIYASNLNGGVDQNPANDELETSFLVHDNLVPRVPLFEILTSSTCPPCKPANENFHGIVDTRPKQDFVSIKFQQNFPGTGDPYCTTEAVNRANYYGVTSIPNMQIDGGFNDNAAAFTERLYTTSRKNPAYTFLTATYTVDTATKLVTVNVDALPIKDYATGNYKLQVAIIENKTTANVRTNNETEFFEVMKKMIPNENGTTITSLNEFVPYTFDDTYTFNGNYRLPTNGQAANRINHATEHSVEEFTDLSVVVWIENRTTKEVLQAFNAVSPLDSDGDQVPDEVESYSSTDPNDATDFPDLDNDNSSDWTEVTSGSNPLVADAMNDIDQDGFTNDVDCNDYNAAVNSGATEIQGNGIDDDCDPATSDAVGINEIDFADDLVLSPVPANNNINLSFTLGESDNVEVSIVSLDGKVISNQTYNNVDLLNETYNISSLSNGVYLMKINTEDATTVRKFVVAHQK